MENIEIIAFMGLVFAVIIFVIIDSKNK